MRAAIIFVSITVVSAMLGASPELLMRAQITSAPQDDLALESSPPQTGRELPLDAAQRLELDRAIQSREYQRAEKLLVEEANRVPESVASAKLLAMAGGVFFLDGQYLNSVIAWRKADAIAPLDESSRFTMAMAYVHLNRRGWARPELEKLATANPGNPLFLYWLARLDYDGGHHASAIARFQKVIELDPRMMRAYDGLGLCHDYLGRIDDAIGDYHHAIELNRQQLKPSPWPHVDLAIALMEKNQLPDAEKSLREAIQYDPRLPQAYFELGRVLDKQGHPRDAIETLKRAVDLDNGYPEPHYSLGRIYQRLGEGQLARAEIDRFNQLTKARNEESALGSQPPTK